MNGCERTLGFDKSNPIKCNKLNKAEPVRVNARLTKNCMVSLLSFPNIKIEIRADRTNIQANEQINTVTFASEFNHEAKVGIEPPKEDVTVDRAD
ncbi:MAG TPA: hypothetical protein VF350_07405 [Candidatus Bathyarchaeia archaeon]